MRTALAGATALLMLSQAAGAVVLFECGEYRIQGRLHHGGTWRAVLFEGSLSETAFDLTPSPRVKQELNTIPRGQSALTEMKVVIRDGGYLPAQVTLTALRPLRSLSPSSLNGITAVRKLRGSACAAKPKKRKPRRRPAPSAVARPLEPPSR